MNKLLLTLSEFEQKLLSYVQLLQQEKKQKQYLEQENTELNQKLAKQIHLNRELQQENDRLKIVNAMLGEKEHRRLMKLKMNKLIKEVDHCINTLNQKS